MYAYVEKAVKMAKAVNVYVEKAVNVAKAVKVWQRRCVQESWYTWQRR